MIFRKKKQITVEIKPEDFTFFIHKNGTIFTNMIKGFPIGKYSGKNLKMTIEVDAFRKMEKEDECHECRGIGKMYTDKGVFIGMCDKCQGRGIA